MTRITYTLLFSVLAVLASACAMQDGEPWGWVEGGATASGSIVEEGGAPGAQVTIDSASATLGVRLVETTSSSAGSGATFDPQSPPDGYGLCHNGHCHSDDGELVPYEDIRAELASSGGTVERTVARLAGQGGLAAPISLERQAVVEPATVDTVEVEFNLSIAGSVMIDGDVYALEIVTGPFLMTSSADLAFGPDEPAERTVGVDAAFDTADFFDGVDWAAAEQSGDTIKFTQTINKVQRDALIVALREGSLSFQAHH
ncbi:MAG: hypothetical protein ACQEVA_12080 [Myxococcota bacterium]